MIAFPHATGKSTSNSFLAATFPSDLGWMAACWQGEALAAISSTMTATKHFTTAENASEYRCDEENSRHV